MKQTVAYALLAILMSCVVGLAVTPLSDYVKASVTRVSRILRTSPRS